MTLSGNQPYFLPYLGYWQLIHAADGFLIADDYDYIKAGWVNRNKILVNGHPHYFRVEMVEHTPSRLILDKKVAMKILEPLPWILCKL